MKINEAQAIADIVLSEGDEVNVNPPNTPPNQGEPGGASKFGISVVALSDFRVSKGLAAATITDVKALTEDDATAFYSGWVMPQFRFDDLPSGDDYAIFDKVTNLGLTGGISLVELTLGRLPLTGRMTDDLLVAVKAAEARTFIVALGAAWIAEKHTQPSWAIDGHGWSNRRARVDAQALAMVSP